MKIAIITTVNHNVGDDFVREGIKYLLRQYFKGKKLKFTYIHKHSPITVRYGFEWLRDNRIGRRIDRVLPLFLTRDRILEADLVVQSGAPVYWCHEIGGGHCYQNEWYVPLIKYRFLKNKNAKLLNLAAGTCQRYYSDGNEFCTKCKEYIKELFSLSTVTTLRDSLAKVVLNNVGVDAPVIPCSSIFAIDEYNLKNEGEEYVVLNYMKGGGHYTFGQKIDFEKYRKEFAKFYFELKKRERVIISCHNRKEVKEVIAFDPRAEIFYKKNDYLAYMKFYSKAKFGIVNRVHAAFILASFGKPSIVIGNDSRALMPKEIGLKTYFVNDINSEILNEGYNFLKSTTNNFKERFRVIKIKAYNDYIKALSIL